MGFMMDTIRKNESGAESFLRDVEYNEKCPKQTDEYKFFMAASTHAYVQRALSI